MNEHQRTRPPRIDVTFGNGEVPRAIRLGNEIVVQQNQLLARQKELEHSIARWRAENAMIHLELNEIAKAVCDRLAGVVNSIDAGDVDAARESLVQQIAAFAKFVIGATKQ